MKNMDWIGLIEAGYNLDGTDQLWLENLLDKAVPLFDRGFWPSIMTYRFTPTTVDIDHVVTKGPSEIIKPLFDYSTSWSPGAVDQIYRGIASIESLSTIVYPGFPRLRAAFGRRAKGMEDMLAVWAHTGIGSGLKICRAFPTSVTPTAMERKRWPLVASHLGAALRLPTIFIIKAHLQYLYPSSKRSLDRALFNLKRHWS